MRGFAEFIDTPCGTTAALATDIDLGAFARERHKGDSLLRCLRGYVLLIGVIGLRQLQGDQVPTLHFLLQLRTDFA